MLTLFYDLLFVCFMLFFFLRWNIYIMELPQWFSGKDLPAMQETQVRSLEDPREECMADHSSILARKIPWREEPASYSPRGSRESDMPEGTEHTYTLKCTILTDRDGLFTDTHKSVSVIPTHIKL